MTGSGVSQIEESKEVVTPSTSRSTDNEKAESQEKPAGIVDESQWIKHPQGMGKHLDR